MNFGRSSLGSRRRTALKWSLFGATAVVAIAIDLWTKYLAQQHLVIGETHKILPFFYLERTANSGVAFGLMGGKGVFIIVANVVALAVVVVYVTMERRPLLAGLAGGTIVGGSLGNLIQRLFDDWQVTDFLKFPHWPNYNMADVFIFCGIAAVFLGLVLEAVRVWKAGQRETPASQ